MSRVRRHRQGKGALELIEEAVHLLRTAPGGVLASYYVGTLPFALGLLYFWTDMSRSPWANQHLGGATLGMAALFLWMKFWQALFARGLRGVMAGKPLAWPSLRESRRIFAAQAALQPTGLFVLPLGLVLVLPALWVLGFYQSLTALGDGQAPTLRVLLGKAGQQAARWPSQAFVVLLVLSGFGLCVFLNWTTVCLLLPGLVKMLFGFESAFTRSGLGMLNTTFLVTMFCLTYLSVDPLLKAVYALRCFYGESLQSGEDLRAELGRFTRTAQQIAACLLLALATTTVCKGADALGKSGKMPELAAPASSRIDSPPNPGVTKAAAGETRPAVSASELDRKLDEVIRQNKYSWRAPREKLLQPAAREKGVVGRFFERVWNLIKDWVKAALKWIGKALEWLARLLERLLGRFFRAPRASVPGGGWVMGMNILLYVLVAAVVLALGYLAYRIWLNWQRAQEPIATEPIRPAPDLADENVGAEQLPEGGWMKLAREMLERGELRLALRALYLASLAHLAERNFITIAKFKSNRDYERELLRRGHSFPELLATFGQNVSVFDRSWYGLHEVNADLVSEFAANVERIKGAAA